MEFPVPNLTDSSPIEEEKILEICRKWDGASGEREVREEVKVQNIV